MKAKVNPVFRSENADLPQNYCPISILPVFSKILEKAINQKLLSTKNF